MYSLRPSGAFEAKPQPRLRSNEIIGFLLEANLNGNTGGNVWFPLEIKKSPLLKFVRPRQNSLRLLLRLRVAEQCREEQNLLAAAV